MSRHRFGLRQSLAVIVTIGWSDFRLKYHGSFFGYLWSLVAPIVKYLVILHVFRPFVGQTIEHYPLYLFLGLILWEYFSYTTAACMTVLFDKAEIIKHLPFPRILLMLIVGWTQIIVFSTHFIVFLMFAWWYGMPLLWNSLYMLVVVAQMSMIALGIGMFLGAYSLKYRDLEHLWNIGLQVLFWLTPVVYGYASNETFARGLIRTISGVRSVHVTDLLTWFIQFQPLSIIINDARRATLYPLTIGTPSALHAAGFTFICALIFAIGATMFRRRSVHFIQEY